MTINIKRKLVSFVKLMKNNPLQLFKVIGDKGLLNWLPDKYYLKLTYRCVIGRKLNFNEPKAYTEKIQWRKLNDRNPLLAETADKLNARDYVKKRIGENILTKIYWVGKNPSLIPFDELPREFVLKSNHGCGYNIFIYDKEKIDRKKIIKQLNKWLKYPYGKNQREWAYKNIDRKVYAEELLRDSEGKNPNDYKFFVFSGKSPALFICCNRYGDKRWDFYDRNWNRIEVVAGFPNSSEELKKPSNFELMKKYAEIIGKDLDYVRVDLYDLGDRVVFGEMTHYPASGLSKYVPSSYDYWIGAFWKLPKIVS
jgi:hypothetical protein